MLGQGPRNVLAKTNARKITIGRYETKKEFGMKNYLVYTIKCDPPLEDNVLRVRRRYRWFQWLRGHLKQMYPAMFVPPLPPKKLMANARVNVGGLAERRKEALERWLNRIESNRVFSETDAMRVFLVNPESTMKESMKECESKLIRDDGEMAYAIQNIFPEIHKTPLPDTYQDDWVRLNECLARSKEQLDAMGKTLSELIAKTTGSAAELSKMVELLKVLHDGESENPIRELVSLERPDLTEQLTAFAEYRENETENIGDLFKHITYEAQDVGAALELLSVRDGIDAKYQKLAGKVEKWEAQTALSDKQAVAKDKDLLAMEQCRDLLEIVTKVVVEHEVQHMWNGKLAEFRKQIGSFAQSQQTIAVQLAESWAKYLSMVG